MDTISIGTTRSLGGKKQRQITILVDNDREKTGVVELMRRIEKETPIIMCIHNDMLLTTYIPWENEHNNMLRAYNNPFLLQRYKHLIENTLDLNRY